MTNHRLSPHNQALQRFNGWLFVIMGLGYVTCGCFCPWSERAPSPSSSSRRPSCWSWAGWRGYTSPAGVNPGDEI